MAIHDLRVDHRPERRRLCRLKQHPNQADWFAPLSDQELALLAQSMARVGLQHPIHILPDGTILAGHQRVAAAQRLGWKTIDCVVRWDLADDPAEAAIFAISDNLRRRQLGPLELARAYKALRETESQQEPGTSAKWGEERQDLRDRLAKHLGKSGRQLDRYLRLLELPLPIQTAITNKQLPVSLAERLFRIPQEQRELIALAIAAGSDPRVEINRLLPERPKQIRPRLERPSAAKTSSDLLILLRVFQTGHFDAYVRLVERRDPEANALEMLRKARCIAHSMFQGLSKYVQVARAAGQTTVASNTACSQ